MTKSQNVTAASNELGNYSNVGVSSPSKEQRQSKTIMTPASRLVSNKFCGEYKEYND